MFATYCMLPTWVIAKQLLFLSYSIYGERNVIGVCWFFYFSTNRWNDGTLIFSKVFTQFSIFKNRVFIILDIISYNITSGMIIIDDIMSEIELEISRVWRTSEMSCFNFTNLISSMINHTTCYIRRDNIINEIKNYSFICQTDKFISIKNRNDESK
jgi:hypothetical protein